MPASAARAASRNEARPGTARAAASRSKPPSLTASVSCGFGEVPTPKNSGSTLQHNTTYSSPHHKLKTQKSINNNKSDHEQEEELMLKIQEMMYEQNGGVQEVEKERSFVDQPQFESAIAFFIILNALQMGCALAATTGVWLDVWLVFEHMFTSVFFVEMCLKLYCLGWKYFRSLWNLLDFGLVWISVMDSWVLSLIDGIGAESLDTLRLFRLLRIIRLLKVLKHNPDIIVLIQGIGGSIKSMIPISMLLCLIIYSMSLVCVQVLMRDNEREKFENMVPPFNVEEYFGSLPRAWLTLFNMVILAEWPEVVRPIFGVLPLLVFPFVVFVTLCSFAIMNVVIGIICQQTDEATARCQAQAVLDDRATQMRLVKELVHTIAVADADGDGTIDISEFANESVKALLLQIELPPAMTPEETHIMLDFGGDGTVTIEECLTSMFRLINATDFQKECLNTISLNHIKQLTTGLQRGQDAISESMREVMKELRGLRSDVCSMSRDGSSRQPPDQADAYAAAAQPLMRGPSARAIAAPVSADLTKAVWNTNVQPADPLGIPEVQWINEALDSSQQALQAVGEKQEETLRLLRALSSAALPSARAPASKEQSQVTAASWGNPSAATIAAPPQVWPSGLDSSSSGDCVSALTKLGIQLPSGRSRERDSRSAPPTPRQWPLGKDPGSPGNPFSARGYRSTSPPVLLRQSDSGLSADVMPYQAEPGATACL